MTRPDESQGGAAEPFPAYDELLQRVPEYDRFPRVDELEAATSKLVAASPAVRVWQCGVSAHGHPLRCLEVGSGPRRALLLGFVHPEEPVGSLVIEELLPLFAETSLAAELGFRFSILKTLDPDAARLNEPWFDRPGDLSNFVLHVYRSAYIDQPVWNFPVAYRRYTFAAPPPETRAAMAIIDREPLDFIMSLHNCSFGGGYFYLSDHDPELLDALAATRRAAGVPPHRGEPELPYLRSVGDAMYADVRVADEYEHLTRYGHDPLAKLAAGADSDEYAIQRWGCCAVLAEVPAFMSARVADTTPAGLTRAEAKLRGIAREQEHVEFLRRCLPALRAAAPEGQPWRRAVEGYLSDAAIELPAEARQAQTEPVFAHEASVAQAFDSLHLRELHALCRVGQFVRAADEALKTGGAALGRLALGGELAALGEAAEQRVRTRVTAIQTETGITPVPIRRRVQMQLGALLVALDFVRERLPAHRRRL